MPRRSPWFVLEQLGLRRGWHGADDSGTRPLGLAGGDTWHQMLGLHTPGTHGAGQAHRSHQPPHGTARHAEPFGVAASTPYRARTLGRARCGPAESQGAARHNGARGPSDALDRVGPRDGDDTSTERSVKHRADRLDPIRVSMIVDEADHHFGPCVSCQISPVMVKYSPARIDPEEAAIGRPTPTARRLVEARRGHLGPLTWRPCSHLPPSAAARARRRVRAGRS